MLTLKIVFRNILRQKRRSALTCLMMTAGLVLLSVSMGISDGSYSAIIEIITREHTGHVQVHNKGYLDSPSVYSTIKDAGKLEKQIASLSGVQSSAPRLYSGILLFAGKKSTGARIIGIDPDKEAQTTRLDLKVTKGEYISKIPKKSVVLSDQIARVLDIKTGEEIILIGQGADGSIANDLFTVSGITGDKGAGSGRMACYMHIQTAQEFLSLPNGIHEIAIVLFDGTKAKSAAKKIRQALNDPTIDIEPWQKVEKEFYQAMQTHRKGRAVGFTILMIVVGIGILDTVLMTILERTPEFGLMRAMGTRPFDMFKLIIMETAFLSFAAIIIGWTIAFICNYMMSRNGIALSKPFYSGGVYFEKFVSTISLEIFLLPALITFFTAILVSILPAYRAGYIPPVQAMESA